MNLYYHHVGTDGARRDFPKTVFKSIPMSVAEEHLPRHAEGAELLIKLRQFFPEGFFNAWGVPSGAKYVINNLSYGDAVLLVESLRFTEVGIPALAKVALFRPIQLHNLSHALWDDAKYPYIFFFRTERVELPWRTFLEDVGYKEKWNPRGKFLRVKEENLTRWGGSHGYVAHVRRTYGGELPPHGGGRSPPLPETDDLKEDLAVTDVLAGKNVNGQGYSDVALRKAIEENAMRQARHYFERLGWAVDPEPARTECFDLQCEHPVTGERMRVEVKGTTGSGSKVFLTRNEVVHAKEQFPRIALYVLANIRVREEAGTITVSYAEEIVFNPWKISDEGLSPIAYSYELPRATQSEENVAANEYEQRLLQASL